MMGGVNSIGQDKAKAAEIDISTDVVIVGGGLVGGTLACALGQAGVDVLVIEAGNPAATLAAGFDGRASAVALSSRRLLENTGLWEGIRAEASPILDIRVSEGGSHLFLHYDHRDVGDQPFGHMVENRVLRRAILDRMSKLKRVQMLAPARLLSLKCSMARVEAKLEDGRRILAQLVVGADGRGSWVRRNARIRVTEWSYGQWAIVCTVAHERPHQNIAHEHFLPSGPFAILPLLGNRSSIVWTERQDLAPAMLKLPEDAFLSELRRRFGDFLGDIQVIGPRWGYPLSLQYAETTIAERLALVGDAAHAIHPIAGQGLNLGWRDVAALTEVIVDRRRLGLDVGSPCVLERYQRWRRFDNTLMMAATDGLNRLFSNDWMPLRVSRDVGLAVVNRMGPLKRFFMRHAMGNVGELPRLMRAL
jgi:2-octaprenyl-6-methoxyphenol hydroxylase